MKNKKFSKTFKLSNGSLYAGFLMLGLLTFACETGQQDESKEGAEPREKGGEKVNRRAGQDTSLFRGNAEFLEKLFALSDCKRDESGFIPPTGPIICSHALDALHLFCETYRAGNGLDYFPTKIETHGALGDLFSEFAGSEFGLVFHYGFDTDKDEIVYMLSKGKLDTSADTNGKVSYCPFTAGDSTGSQEDHYLLIKSGASEAYKSIDTTEFKNLKNQYAANMLRHDGNAFADIDTSAHPLMVYHDPSGLLDFYEKYKNENNARLYIAHGSIQAEGATQAYHTPCFVFGNDSSFFELDNRDYMGSGESKYTKKGLDIGRLCPPKCREPLSPCFGK